MRFTFSRLRRGNGGTSSTPHDSGLGVNNEALAMKMEPLANDESCGGNPSALAERTPNQNRQVHFSVDRSETDTKDSEAEDDRKLPAVVTPPRDANVKAISDNWMRQYNRVKAHCEKTGTLKIHGDLKLQNWMSCQRYKSKLLLPQQRQLLDAIGFDFQRQDRKRAPKGIVEEDFYEVESIVDHRRRKGHEREWLVAWVGYEDRTWVADCNLCDSAKAEATAFLRKQKPNRKRKRTGASPPFTPLTGSKENPVDLTELSSDEEEESSLSD